MDEKKLGTYKIDYDITDEIGFLTEERSLLLKLTVKELMMYYGTLKSMKKDKIEKNLKYWLKKFNIEEYENKKIKELSKGNKQKIQFISSIIHEPKLLILDKLINVCTSLFDQLVISGMIILLSLLSEKFLKKQTFGNGDVYAFGALGAVVGADNLIMFLIYAVFIQFLYILPEYIKTIIKDENKEKLKYFISFVSACLFFYVFRNINFWGSKLLLTMLLGFVVFCGINIIKNLLISVKTDETHSCSPILPSLAICALIFLC